MIIGLGGAAGSGKDSAAHYLVERHGFEQVAFAEPLKAGCEALFAFNPEQLHGALKEVIDRRLGKAPREVM